jgi:hypothetical protein
MFLKLSTSPKADNFESFEHAHRNVTALLKWLSENDLHEYF